MAYSAVTKPAVGDPIKLSTITGIIDNQDHFNSTITSGGVGFAADGDFEATPASGPASGWTDGGGAATIARSNNPSGANGSGEYSLKFSGNASETNYVETALFPISEYKPYALSISCKTDAAGDQFTVSFITVERDGATSVQTVTNPVHSDGTNSGLNPTTWKNFEWVVDGGTNSRFAKIKIAWTCNSTAASAGYVDNFTITEATRSEYRFYLPLFISNGAHSFTCHAPNWMRTTITTYDDTTNEKRGTNETSWLDMTTPNDAAQTADFVCDEVTKSANQGATIAGDGNNKSVNYHGVISWTPRHDNFI
jgi:hypothetical protein